MKRYRLSIALALLIFTTIACLKIKRNNNEDEPLVALRAVSLRAMQELAANLKPGDLIPDDYRCFFGITRVHGFLADTIHDDIVIYGTTDKSYPPLHFEDFIIALRNAWYKYAPISGNIVNYSNPSCSIDPDSTDTKELYKLFGGKAEFEQEKPIWDTICVRPQKVSVWGVPFTSNFARVMVDADYYMKKLVDGSANMNIRGFTSLMDTAMNIMIGQVKMDKPSTMPVNPINRFWFYPGNISMVKCNSDILIKSANVKLLTEAEVPNKNGKTSGTGKADPLANHFANSFSEHYSEIARQKQVFSELENIFRLVAIAKAIRYDLASNKEDINSCCQTSVGLDLSFFLNDYSLMTYDVKSSVPGIPNLKSFQYKKADKKSEVTRYLWLPSCGGVSIDIDLDNDNFIDVTHQNMFTKSRDFNRIKEVRTKTLQPFEMNKPPKLPLWWDIIMKTGSIKVYSNVYVG